MLGAAAALIMWPWLSTVEPALLRLTLASSVVFGVHAVTLLFAFGEKSVYVDLLTEAGLWPSSR
jgi:hypothetical protein